MDEEELEEILGKDYDPELAKKMLEEAVDKINADSPMFKKIRKIIIRKTDFVKNASKKLIRFAPENKEEQ
jgi:long-chain acyl-CoA synthetase